jgi:hypothetical protein
MCARNENSIALQKPIQQTCLSYDKEITLAVMVKFLLLGGLWWLFFAGHKQPVNGDSFDVVQLRHRGTYPVTRSLPN